MIPVSLSRRHTLLIAAFSAFAQCASAAENAIFVDVTAELSARLAKKPGARKERTVESKETICDGTGRKIPCGSPVERMALPVLPKPAGIEGAVPMCFESRCRTVRTRTPVTVVEPLVATGHTVVQVNEMKTLDARTTLFPPKTFIKQVEKANCSATESSAIDEGLSFTTQSTVSTSVRRGIRSSTTVNASVSFKLPSGFGSSLGASVNQSTSLDRSETQSTATTINQTARISEKVPPRTRTRVDVVLYETSLEVPFAGSVLVDGPVDANQDGLQKVSQLLNAQDRTIAVDGVLAVTASTLSQSKRIDRPVTAQECEEIEAGKAQAYSIRELEYAGTGANTLNSTRADRRAASISAAGTKPRPPRKALRQLLWGTPGNICYIGPCNRPLDGYREYCYYDDEGACADCGDESDPICEPDGPEELRTKERR